MSDITLSEAKPARGSYRMARGWMDNPVFKREPYTEREAWLWLIEHAAFLPHSRKIGHNRIELKRGQVAASMRYLAAAWKWSEARVRRFLRRLKGDAMIDAPNDAASDAPVTVISLVNYDTYQARIDHSDAASDAASDGKATQIRINDNNKGEREARLPATILPLDFPASNTPKPLAVKKSVRPKQLYKVEAGCTIDSYQPDPITMGAWAAEHAPLVLNPVSPETVEEIRDQWRRRGEKPKDFDATYRTYLRKRQGWAAEKVAAPTNGAAISRAAI
jgi:hypothetical protein